MNEIIEKGLKLNPSMKLNEDTICPCKKMREESKCCCKLYLNK